MRRLKAQVDEFGRQNHDLNNLKAQLTHENLELHRQVQDLDNSNALLAKLKSQLQAQLDETKSRLDDESRVSDTSDRYGNEVRQNIRVHMPLLIFSGILIGYITILPPEVVYL